MSRQPLLWRAAVAARSNEGCWSPGSPTASGKGWGYEKKCIRLGIECEGWTIRSLRKPGRRGCRLGDAQVLPIRGVPRSPDEADFPAQVIANPSAIQVDEVLIKAQVMVLLVTANLGTVTVCTSIRRGDVCMLSVNVRVCLAYIAGGWNGGRDACFLVRGGPGCDLMNREGLRGGGLQKAKKIGRVLLASLQMSSEDYCPL